jgi:hypothetical protein
VTQVSRPQVIKKLEKLSSLLAHCSEDYLLQPATVSSFSLKCTVPYYNITAGDCVHLQTLTCSNFQSTTAYLELSWSVALVLASPHHLVPRHKSTTALCKDDVMTMSANRIEREDRDEEAA